MCCLNTTVVLDKSPDIGHNMGMDKAMMTTEQINNLAKDIAELTCEEFVDYQYDIMVDDLCALFEQNEYAARSYDNDAIDYGKKI
jgi:hypothetical protein